MEFKIEKKTHHNVNKYGRDDINIAYEFTKKLHKELKDLLKAVVLFGSAARQEKSIYEKDIDILIIINDLGIKLSAEVVEAYRIIVEKLVIQTSVRIHITTLKFTNFWDYIRAGDPVGINMLRDGVPLYDTGFFEALQQPLKQGRIRPTQESIWTYFARAPATIFNSKWHLLQATLDLYWGVIDAAHAALMSLGEIPPTPAHVADLLESKMVKHKLLEKKYAETMKKFYNLSRGILHKQIREITGKEYDIYLKEAKAFVDRIEKFVDKKDRF